MAGNGKEIAQILKMLEKIQDRIDESDKKIETMAIAFQNCNKEPHGEEVDDEEEGEDERVNLEVAKKGEEEERSTPPGNS